MGKKQIKNYLLEKKSYTCFDRVLEGYVNGKINNLLLDYNNVGIYYSLKQNKTIQLTYCKQNIYVIIDFFENNYSVAVYPKGVSIEKLEMLIENFEYSENFCIKQLIEEIDVKIKNHPELKNIVPVRRKSTVFSIIAWINFCLPIIVWISISIFCLVTEIKVSINPLLAICLTIIPLILWLVFDIKSKRL